MNSMAVSSVWLARRGELDALVVAVRADVGLFLGPHTFTTMSSPRADLTDDHALVDDLARRDEQLASLLQVVEGVSRWCRPGGRRSSRRPCDAGRSPAHGVQPAWCVWSSAVPRVSVSRSQRKPMSPRAGASQVMIVRPGSPLRRSMTRPLRGASAWVTVPTCSSGTSHTPRSSGSWRLPSTSRGDDLGPAHLHLVALAPHRLDEHGELQLAPAGDIDDVGRVGVGQADRHVAEHFALEAIAQMTAR